MKAPKFEGSKWDDDRGVKEGSKTDKKRDIKEKKEMKKAIAKKK